MEELKRCPFCGVKPQERIGGRGSIMDVVYYVVPHGKKCFLYQAFGQLLSIGKEVEQWNTRAKE